MLVLAHGEGAAGVLPWPLWLIAFLASAAVVLAFAIAVIAGSRPWMERAAAGVPVPTSLDRALTGVGVPVARVLGVIALLVVLAAGLLGRERSPVFPVATNIAPVTITIVFWQYGQVAAAVLGDVWRVLSPFDTLALVGRRLGLVPPDEPEPPTGSAPVAEAASPERLAPTWPAFLGIGGFLWLELAYHDGTDIRLLGAALLGYTVWVMANVTRSGRGWLARGEGFTVLFGLLAHLAPVHRGEDGRLRVRVPGSGLGLLVLHPSTVLLLLTLVGAAGFDGFSDSSRWGDIVGDTTGWESTGYNTVGLAVFVAAATVLWFGACWVAGRITGRHELDVAEDQGIGLVPVVLGAGIAHYVSSALFEGQGFIRALSDPFGRGWDLVGTADRRIDYQLVSDEVIAWVQVLALAIGPVVAALACYDRAREQHPPDVALRASYPIVAVLLAYVVAGVVLLAA